MPAGLSHTAWRAVQAAAPVVISGAALFWMSQSVDWGSAAADALRAPMWAVTACVGLVFVQISLCGVRLSGLSRSVGAPVARETATAVWGISYLAGLTLPSSVGSELVKGGLLLRWMRYPGRILGVVALERLLALAAMVMVVLIAAPLLAFAAGRPEAGWIAAAAVFALVLIAGGYLLRRPVLALLRDTAVKLGAPAPAAEGIETVLATSPLAAMTGLSALVHLMTLVMIALLAVGLGVDDAWTIALLGGPLVVFASMLPISVGGLGVREGAAVVVFGALGAGASEAASITLALWGSQILAGAFTAGGAMTWMLLQRRTANDTQLPATSG